MIEKKKREWLGSALTLFPPPFGHAQIIVESHAALWNLSLNYLEMCSVSRNDPINLMIIFAIIFPSRTYLF